MMLRLLRFLALVRHDGFLAAVREALSWAWWKLKGSRFEEIDAFLHPLAGTPRLGNTSIVEPAGDLASLLTPRIIPTVRKPG